MSVDEAAPPSTAGLSLILTTVADATAARALASRLLAEGLAACVQLQEIDSLYVWKGRVEEEDEVRMLIKTPSALLNAAMDAIARLHPYEVPQIVAVEASAVALPYLQWTLEVTR
ncbi:MAG: divalent-cation tolerance protein CutA [Pseudomonadales bacterium]|jgi:periplasmic divalent cation tolerance protein|nr:divalent-cation tolerance protein CutA [Pseudomonadales bacterium]